MKRFLLSSVLLLGLSACAGQAPPPETRPAVAPRADTPITASIDLTQVSNDRLLVTIEPGALGQNEVLYRLPRVVQGTYAISDFGSFTEDFRATDRNGAAMVVEHPDPDTWRITNAGQLNRITYYVNDTYDIERTPGSKAPFSPSGTNIDPDIFVLNLHGFVGYFEGMTDRDYEIRITAPADMEKSSALRVVSSDRNVASGTVTDVYHADRYFQVTDNPMMYGNLTTTSFRAGDIDIVLSVYSPSGTHTAEELTPELQRTMTAQRAYLGDLETTNRYDVYLFLSNGEPDSPTGFGALEHQTSTVAVFRDDMEHEAILDHMRDVVSHEFFHIVSPLSVHSEDIQDFDYHTPTFSKHLWMYEGQTEYFASHFQVYEGLEEPADFYAKMAGKVDGAKDYDDTMSFTVMSEHITDEPYASNYADVYQKGALIGMCLDVMLRSESGGRRSLISFMKELSDRYGKQRAFDDDTIIDEVTSMTYPEVGAFLRTHVVGGTPIDYGDCLEPVGIAVSEEQVRSTPFFLSADKPYINIRPDTGEIYVRNIPLNTSMVALGLKAGDVIRSVNGAAYNASNLNELVQNSVAWTPETDLTIVVDRDGSEIELSGKLGTPMGVVTKFTEIPDATPEQLAIRKAWLNR